MSWAHNDDYLYHYTSADGLLGILGNQSIWATDSDYLNDGADCKVVDNHLRTYLNEGSFRRPFHGTRRQQDVLEAHLQRGCRTFVASFSRIPNSLTQFRMYAPDDGGFVLGFPRSALEKAGHLIDVCYNEGEQEVWCRNFIDKFCENADRYDDGTLDPQKLADLADPNQTFLNRRIAHGIRNKSSEFAQEQEVRLICHTGSLKLRPSRRGNVLLPYIEVELPNEPMLIKVAAGPGQYQNSIASQGLYHLQLALGERLGEWAIGVLSIGESSHRVGF